MIYLAHVAGKVAHSDSRDRINGAERLSQLEKSVPIPRSASSTNTCNLEDSSGTHNTESKISPASITGSSKDTEPIIDSFGHENNSLYPILNEDRFTVPPLTTAQSMRQRPSTSLSDIEYIASTNDPDEIKSQNILTDVEAQRLIKLFFVTLHPFYPYIPKTLRDPKVLASYPILLCALLAISARYNPLPDKIGDWDNIADNDTEKRRFIRGEKNVNVTTNSGDRHLAVHEQLWIYCQRLMSMTVWGESSSRSVGTLLTFLLFTEWNPRAIHFRWGDYANSSYDDSLANRKINKNSNVGRSEKNSKNKKNSVFNNSNNQNPSSDEKLNRKHNSSNSTPIPENNNNNIDNDDNKNNGIDNENENENRSFSKHTQGYQYSGNTSNDCDRIEEDEEEFAGLSAMKRSEIMSFMLIGTATRLSFLLETDPLIFIATHVSEIHIAVGLNKKSMLQQTLSEVDVNEPSYQFTSYQKGSIELLQFFSLCYETLYGTRPKFISLDKYQTLAILDILSPILENWYRKYYKLLKPSNIHCAPLAACNDDGSPDWLYLISLNPKLDRDLTVSIERESLILDYYYTKLYLYSLALSGDTSVNANLRNSKKGRNLRLDELARYSRYVELAYKAAKEVLAVIQRVRKLRLLKYMPVRWVTRVIKSVSFIVKCYLTLTTDIQTNTTLDEGISKHSTSLSPAHVNMKDENIYTTSEKLQNTNGEILKLSVIPLEEIITLLQKTAICLRYAAPDELHLCTRYSTILMYLCSQFKTQMRERNEKLKNGIREYEKDMEFEESNSQDEEQNDDVSNKRETQESNLKNESQQQQSQQHQHGQPHCVQQMYENYEHIQPQQPQLQQQQQQQQAYNNNFINNSNIPNSNPIYNVNSSSTYTDNMIPQPFTHMNIDTNSINFSNANQELFDDFFNKNPSEKLFNFFSMNDNNPGLDFVDQFTKEIEKDFLSKGGKH